MQNCHNLDILPALDVSSYAEGAQGEALRKREKKLVGSSEAVAALRHPRARAGSCSSAPGSYNKSTELGTSK